MEEGVTRPNAALGEFLRSRRARLDPDEAGVISERQRRVQGLRRTELADLAGMSVDYYKRLEQGRHASASPSVLDAIARALRLSEPERAYLHRLAEPSTPMTGKPAFVRPETRHLMQALGVLAGPSPRAAAAGGAHAAARVRIRARLARGGESLDMTDASRWAARSGCVAPIVATIRPGNPARPSLPWGAWQSSITSLSAVARRDALWPRGSPRTRPYPSR